MNEAAVHMWPSHDWESVCVCVCMWCCSRKQFGGRRCKYNMVWLFFIFLIKAAEEQLHEYTGQLKKGGTLLWLKW